MSSIFSMLVSNTKVTLFLGGAMLLVVMLSGFTHVPIMLEDLSEKDIVELTEPTRLQVFYGDLDSFPHTYEIRAVESFNLSMDILVPNIDGSTDNISGIIIKERPQGGRVEEIARLSKAGPWPTDFEPVSFDSYRRGPSFEGRLEPGVYRIEISTPDNREKYVLRVGETEEFSVGYFKRVGRIGDVKVFFEKSRLRVVESPLVCIPLLIIGVWVYLKYRRKRGKEGGV